MRFERLILGAYGPFTDEELDLSGGSPGGLHVIYGPNEAGKSTSLRAVKALLFGIPHQCPDAHTHGGNKLRVSARLSDGAATHFVTRLKRRKDDLVDEEGKVLSVDPLPALLGNLDEVTFSSRFGLDQEALRRGAEALLGGSEEGLFAAGTAGADVRGLLSDLKSKSEELYKARGRVLPLNRQLIALETAAREAKRAERPPEKWLEQERAWEGKGAEVEQLKQKRAEVRSEFRRLNRLRAHMSELTAWHEATTRLNEIGDVPRLPENARERRLDAEVMAAEARVEARRIRLELEQFESELKDLPPRSPLTDVDEEQLGLSTRVGTALSARKDLPKRRAALLVEQRALAGYLRELGQEVESGGELAHSHRLLLAATSTATVGRLLTERGGLFARVSEAKRALARIENEIESVSLKEGEDNSSLDVSLLSARLSEAQAHKALVTHLIEDEKRRVALRGKLDRLRAQTGVRLTFQEIAARIPSESEIRSRVGRYREDRKKDEELKGEIERLQEELAALNRKLADQCSDELPSEEGLSERRQERDRSVDEAELEPTQATFRTVREAIVSADDISDRLRREAGRVGEALGIRRAILDHQERILALEAKREERRASADQAEEWQTQFVATLEGTRRVSLSDAEEFCAHLRQLLDTEQEFQVLEATLERAASQSKQIERLLRDCLPDEGLSDQATNTGLVGLISTASRLLRSLVERGERRKNLQESLDRLRSSEREGKAELEEAEEALSRWEDQWEKALKPLGLTRDTSVQRAQEVLSLLERTARTLDAATNLSGRILGMERDTASLAEDVFAIAEMHRPELLSMDAVDAAVELQHGIRAARREEHERGRLKNLISERKAELGRVELRQATADGRLAELVRLARVESASLLPQLESIVDEARALEGKVLKLRQSVRKSSGGATTGELWPEAEKWQGRVGALVDRINDLDEESQRLEQELRLSENEYAGMKLGLDTYGSEDVAHARQTASARRSEALSTLREYLVTSAAHRLLSEQVTRHAERFAGPIVGRARELFERLTLGRYTGLDVGVGEKTLRCVRDKEVLEVPQLSTGTRAQLYLALRIASLQVHFEGRPKVPLVFDDLLLEFDDDRATVAFELLGELAQSVQVLYFSHLARDVEAAENAVPADRLFQHRIGAG